MSGKRNENQFISLAGWSSFFKIDLIIFDEKRNDNLHKIMDRKALLKCLINIRLRDFNGNPHSKGIRINQSNFPMQVNVHRKYERQNITSNDEELKCPYQALSIRSKEILAGKPFELSSSSWNRYFISTFPKTVPSTYS